MKVKIEVSARHVHLRATTYYQLFGKKKPIKKKKLSLKGEWALEQKVVLKGKKGEIDRVRVLYPFRDYDQVEISRTDCFILGVFGPVRDSHELNLEGTPGISLIGPRGKVDLEKGVIIAWRHIHMNLEDAGRLGLKDGDIVKVDIDNDPRSLVFENVLVRVSGHHNKTVMHIDTDEGNAAGIDEIGEGEILI